MNLTVIQAPPSATALAIVIALFAVFLGIMATVVWITINLIIDRYPEALADTKEEAVAKLQGRRRRLLAWAFIVDGAILTVVLFLIIYIINALVNTL